MASFKLIRGCFITVSTFFVFCGVMSPLQSYGRLFVGIQSDLNTTTIQTGWIGSVAWAAHYLVSPLVLVSENYIGYRLTIVIGSIVSSGCYLLSSYMTSFVSLLLVLGVLNGSAIGLCMHSAFCVLFKYFSASGRTRASGVAMLGSSFGAVLLSVFYEIFVPKLGWRFALRMTAIFAAALSIPASFLILPNKDHIRPATEQETGDEGKTNKDVGNASTQPSDESDIGPTRSRTIGLSKVRRILPSKSGTVRHGNGDQGGTNDSQDTRAATEKTVRDEPPHRSENPTLKSRTAAGFTRLRTAIPFKFGREPIDGGGTPTSTARSTDATEERPDMKADEVANPPAQQPPIKSRLTGFRLRKAIPIKSSPVPIEGDENCEPEVTLGEAKESRERTDETEFKDVQYQRDDLANVTGRQSSSTSRKTGFGRLRKVLLPRTSPKQIEDQTNGDKHSSAQLQDEPSESRVDLRKTQARPDQAKNVDSRLEDQSGDITPNASAEELGDDSANPPRQSCAAGPISLCRTWLGIFSDTRAWLIFFAILFPAMSWSVFWMNSISYFKSISIPRESVLVYVIVATISDLFGRVSLTFLVTCFSVKESSLLLASNLIIMVVTLAFLLVPVHPVLIVCSVFIGIGRGWYDILPYKAGVDFLELADSDRGLTLVMMSLGLGFTLGTLPAGAIFDATGSYRYAFIINSVLYLVGGTIQMCMQISRSIRRRRRKDDRKEEQDSQVGNVVVEETPFDMIEDIEN